MIQWITSFFELSTENQVAWPAGAVVVVSFWERIG
jgi:hypothetical protein